MSSRLRKSLISSSIFRRVILISIGSLAVALLSLCALVFVPWLGVERDAKTEIEAELDLIQSTFETQGLEGLLATLDYDNGVIWDDEQVVQIMENNDFIIRVADSEEETLAGFPNLEADYGWAVDYIWLYDFDTVYRAFVLRAELSDDISVSIAKPVNEDIVSRTEQIWAIGAGLILFWVPTTLLIAIWLSRYTHRRLAETAAVVDQVGHDRFDARVDVLKDDEFSQLDIVINEMLDRSEALAKNLEGVSIGVAHDLRTPISNLGGRLQLMERDAGDSQAVLKHVQASQDHIQSLLRTLEALLRLGDVEAGKRKAGFATIRLSDLAMELVETFDPVFAEADKTLSAHISPDLLVIGDKDLLTQMLINLLENILDHARDGARAWFNIKAVGDQVSIIVGDDGPGIPVSRTEQVFERFFRLDSSRNSPGNGLGLSLVKAIAELHGGGAKLVKSNPGAEFEILLPTV